MTESTVANPYASPGADVDPAPSGDASFAPFKRFSAWWVFLLTIVTFGIYAYYWLFTRTSVVNRHYPEHNLSMGLVWTALSVFLLQLVVSFAVGFMMGSDPASAGSLMWLDPLFSLASLVMWFWWIFALRNRLNRISGAPSGDRLYAGPILTFFFGIIYLAYKINQLKDSE